MSKKVLIVILLTATVLATGIVADTAYSGSIPINFRVSGTFIYVHFPTVDRVGILIDIVAKGAPGNAVAKVVGIPGAILLPPNPYCGEGITAQEYDFDDMVITFKDQSMLFATLDYGYVCFGPPPAVFVMDITGGTGKYKNVTGGSLTGTFDAQPVGNSGILYAETGTIVGEILR